ncbi:MAG: OmpA family protein [Dysgonamonadaceae bacterium]|jgi:outer membrane protein OmpA-like peptidoglycan-associated protein|nr:OmpA family protein [Dysgonamonadaceae bacterium]
MKRMSVLLVLLSALFSLPSFAQEDGTLAEAVNRSTRKNNWFVGAGLSANLMHGEQDKLANPLKRIKLGGELSVGKWFNQDFGVRLQGTYGGLRGFQQNAYMGGRYLRPDDAPRYPNPMGVGDMDHYVLSAFSDAPAPLTPVKGRNERRGFWQDFKYSSVTFDLLANFSNLFYGRYDDRLVTVVPFVGGGLVTAYNNDVTTPGFNYVVAKLGLNIDFRLTKHWSVYIEPKAYATNREFDGYEGDAFSDAFTNLSVGVTYTFNKHYSNIGISILNEIDRLNDKVNENRRRLDEHDNILNSHEDLLNKLQNSTVEKPVVIVDDKSPMPLYIRFGLNSYKIEESEQYKIAELADFLNEHKDSNIKLVGYADAKTGNSKYNYGLSGRRTDEVAAHLRAKGISSSRFTLDFKGDKEQPFSQNEWNRVVIAVEQK